jgi:1-acyl-sn-glycerol-3-phosphate acyltransferase
MADDRDVGRLYPVAKRVVTPIFNRLWRLTAEGLDRVPATGGAVICPNHVSVMDSFFLPAVLPRRITFVGKAEYMDSWKTKYLFPALGMIPIDRGGGSAAERALDTAARVLQRGELFGIYPEGTRSRDGKLHKGHTGPARLALRTGVPIVPVGLVGTRDVQPPEAKYPKVRLPVTLRFGNPITVDKYAGRADDRLVLRQIIDEVMFEIRELSGQEYVDEYPAGGPRQRRRGRTAAAQLRRGAESFRSRPGPSLGEHGRASGPARSARPARAPGPRAQNGGGCAAMDQ